MGAYPAHVKLVLDRFDFCSDLPNVWYVSYKSIEKHFSVFFRWFSLRFKEITYVKNVGKQKGFFCFSLNKRIAKKAVRKLDVFLHKLFLENKEKASEKNKEKCLTINW